MEANLRPTSRRIKKTQTAVMDTRNPNAAERKAERIGARKPMTMKTKKTKRTAAARADSLQRLVSRCSEERILQLSNDVSEGIGSGNVREWRAVALYFRNLFDKQHQSIGALRMSLAALTISEEMRTHAVREIAAWVKAANDPSSATRHAETHT
jgi:hypothetical protein